MLRRAIFVPQRDSSDCAAASLAMVARFHRIAADPSKLRSLARTARSGASLKDVASAAGRLGFTTRGVHLSRKSMRSVPLPLIAHVTTEEGLGHFVVVFRAGRRSLLVGDPAGELRAVRWDAFLSRWKGVALLLAPDATRAAGAPGSATPRGTILPLVLRHRGVLLEVFACGLLLTLFGVATAFFIRHLVDALAFRGEESFLSALAIGMLVVTGFRAAFHVLRQYLLARVARVIDVTLISRFIRHLLRLPAAFFETRRVGDILSRVRDAARVREAVAGTLLTRVGDSVLVTVVFTLLWIQDASLATMGFVFAVPLVALAVVQGPVTRRLSREMLERGAALTSHLAEDVTAVETIKACGAETHRAEEAEWKLARLSRSSFALELITLCVSGAGMALTETAGLAVLWTGAHRVTEEALTTGQLLSFYTLVGFAMGPLARLASLGQELEEARVAAERLREVLDEAPEQRDERPLIEFTRLSREIELRDVSFDYGSRPRVLDSLDLRIAAGSRVAIVGESGCGKSTLLKILLRFHEPVSGRFLVDGVDARDLDLAAWRSRVAIVPQDPVILEGTLRENLCLGIEDVELGEIAEAARIAGLDEFISRLPERYETAVGERGLDLSGGQRQRIAIARAVLRRPEIVIFDEATNQLDAATERSVERNLREFLRGKTVLIVSHRLSSVRDADVIHVLEDGRIAESGHHDELRFRGGAYARLWESQTGAPGIADAAAAPRWKVVSGGR